MASRMFTWGSFGKLRNKNSGLKDPQMTPKVMDFSVASDKAGNTYVVDPEKMVVKDSEGPLKKQDTVTIV